MNRRAFITDLGAILIAPIAAIAQQPGKVARIGVPSKKLSDAINLHFAD
jgi:hypothetical protein